MVATINQDAVLTLLCNQTIANIALLQASSVIPSTTALEIVKNDLQNALNEINTRTSFSNVNVSTETQQTHPAPSQASSYSSYPQSNGAGDPNTALVVAYGNNQAPPTLPGRPFNESAQNRAVAMWDYRSDNNDDLHFAVNDAIIIVEEVNADWYKGHLESNPSRIGFFPSNYVRQEPGGSVSTTASQRFVAPPSQQPQQHSFPQPAGQSPNPHGYSQPYGQPGYNPYPNQQYQASHAALPPPHASNDPTALAPVSYAPGPMTTAVTPGGTHAVVTNTDTGKKNRFALKPGSMKSTLAHSAVGGVGFGVGANIVNQIFN